MIVQTTQLGWFLFGLQEEIPLSAQLPFQLAALAAKASCPQNQPKQENANEVEQHHNATKQYCGI